MKLDSNSIQLLCGDDIRRNHEVAKESVMLLLPRLLILSHTSIKYKRNERCCCLPESERLKSKLRRNHWNWVALRPTEQLSLERDSALMNARTNQ
jgi:hypothetical protein